ncbi:MAG: choice-of-anchor P family protein [Candidatus Binatia bacterium]
MNSGCPPDGFKSSSTECRASAGACDLAESCTGTAAACPNDAKSTAECRAQAGDCDVADRCDGTGDACPEDTFEPSSKQCRDSAGVCDLAENCTGDGANCPQDGFEPDTTVCRVTAGVCDVEESCTGTDAPCPADGFQTTGTPCEDEDQIACTEDLCDGAGVCVSTPTNSRCDDQSACTEDECVVAEGGCENTPLPVEPNPVVAGSSNAYGLSVRLGGGTLIAPTPDTDDTDPSNELLQVPAAPLAVVDVLKVEDSSTTGTDGNGNPTIATSATATTAKVQLLQNPPTTGSFTVTATAVQAVANCHADGTTAGSDSEGSVLENVVVGDLNLDTVREPTTITIDDPLLHHTITVSLLEQIEEGAKAGTPQPAAGGTFSSALTVNAIHVRVTNEAGEEVADVVVAHASCSASFAATCVEPPSVSGSGYVVGVTADEEVIDQSHTLVNGEVGSVRLPSTGGSDDATLKHIGPITDDPPTATLVESNAGFSHTEGEVDAEGNSASSATHSQVEMLRVLDNGSEPTNPLIAADLARAECSSTAGSGGSTSAGKTILLAPAFGGGPPICVPIVPGDTCEPLPNSDLPGAPIGTIIRLNEQYCDGGTPTPGMAPTCAGTDASGITVNAIHVFILADGNPFGLPAGADVIIANAHCDSARASQ